MFLITDGLCLPYCSGRYSDFAKKLNANGYKVYGMDWIGKLCLNLDCFSAFFFMSYWRSEGFCTVDWNFR